MSGLEGIEASGVQGPQRGVLKAEHVTARSSQQLFPAYSASRLQQPWPGEDFGWICSE